MMKIRKKIFRVFLIFCSLNTNLIYSFFPINLFRPWDINLRPPQWCNTNLQWINWVEIGLKAQGYNANGNTVNIMKIWTPTQDSLAMLKGFPSSSPMSQFLDNDLMSAEDNGVRGHFDVTGDFKAKGFGFNVRYFLPHNFNLGIYLPLYEMSLKRVQFRDLTYNNDAQDMKVRQLLTGRLQEVVALFDPTLNLNGWSKLGFGDLTLLGEWYRDFPQGKPILKNVSLAVRGGLTLPTGVKNNEDDILFVPFGNDGSVGLLFGGGINLTWFDVFRGGIDVEFLHQFGNTRNRRIKVQQDQTEFLLLAKVPAHLDPGFIQRFNLYLEAYHAWRGLSARATYQFWKESDSKLSLCTNAFSNDIANTAQSLQEWTMHQAIFQVSYDFQCDVPDWSYFKPQLSLFYKFPFNGQRAILLNTVGVIFSLNF
jgi:hypothetical protein